MRVEEKDKTTVLLNLLNERYNASHKMRERSQAFALWVLGFGVSMTWLLVSGKTLTLAQKISLTLFVAVITLLAFFYLRSIEVGFWKNHKVMANLETTLGCYHEGVYCDDPIYPDEFKNLKKDHPRLKRALFYLRSHFGTLHVWIFAIALLVIIMIWASPMQNLRQDKVSSTKSNIERPQTPQLKRAPVNQEKGN